MGMTQGNVENVNARCFRNKLIKSIFFNYPIFFFLTSLSWCSNGFSTGTKKQSFDKLRTQDKAAAFCHSRGLLAGIHAFWLWIPDY
jgi:hypothetical protein